MIKAVLFDLDGTLLDTNELIYKSFDYVFKNNLNLNLSKDEITSNYGQPLHYTFSKYTEDELIVEKLIKDYREYNFSIHDDMCNIFDGVEEVLKTLKDKKIKIGVVTSKREDLAKRGMKISGILKYMDCIVTPEKTDKHKPEPEPVLYACKKLSVEPSEAIMVGDSHFDLMAGKSAGSLTCAVSYTMLELDRLKKVNPSFTVDSLLELINIIEDINR
ncbi:pyrophosphatase PpaX [Clostridium chrysemydis]|uniref:pyrophosphatase PpaX n=1 Tax=Clostridium chrysemydis TaxID=2665504 RepID=UPI0018837A95|nr:pyrophosphatase PpaX [Clostridium chrysemydis]